MKQINERIETTLAQLTVISPKQFLAAIKTAPIVKAKKFKTRKK